MPITLTKKPKNVTVIEGFPGFGLVATITTEYLLNHLSCEKIGSYYFEQLPASVAIHENKIVSPVGIHYCKDYNICIIHAITPPTNVEWKAADIVMEVCTQLQAKLLVSIEGVGSAEASSQRVFHYCNDEPTRKKLGKDATPLGEGIIIGATGALLAKYGGQHLCLFAETHSSMPDSKAAASIVTVLDKLYNLDIDPKPLLKKAEEFEGKIKGIMEKTAQMKEMKEQKELSYMG